MGAAGSLTTVGQVEHDRARRVGRVGIDIGYVRGKFQVTFSEADRPGSAVTLHSSGEVAVALALAGQRVPRRPDPGEVAAMVIAGLRRYGRDRIRALAEWDRHVNGLARGGRVHAELLRAQRDLWGGGERRMQACIDAAASLLLHVNQDDQR